MFNRWNAHTAHFYRRMCIGGLVVKRARGTSTQDEER